MISGGARYMVASAFAFSAMTLFVKLAGERLPSQEIVFARALVTLVLSWIVLRRSGKSPWGRHRSLLVLRGALGFVGLSCVYYAVTHLPLAEATVLQYLHPVFTALLAALVLREGLRASVGLSCVLGLAGVLFVTRPALLFGGAAAPLAPLAVLVAVGGALFSSCAYVVVRRLAAVEDPVVIVFYFPMVAVPASLPAFLDGPVLPRGLDWLWLAGVGVSAQLGQVWMTHGLRREAAGRASAISYVQVLFAAGWGALFFGERPTAWTALGAALVLCGTLLAALHDRRTPPQAAVVPVASVDAAGGAGEERA